MIYPLKSILLFFIKNIISLLTLITILTLTSCLRLDDNLYNNVQIEEYLLDDYEGRNEFDLSESFKIDDDLIDIFTLNSQTEYESEPTTIYAIYIGNQDKIDTDTVIMYFHGTADHMDFYWNRQKLLAHLGGKNKYGVLMIDYRGYGMSEGTPTEEGMYADGKAALDWLKNKGLTDDRLIIYGFSLGTAAATELTASPQSLKPNKLILEAPFASSDVMVNDGSGLDLPSSYMVNFKIDVAEDINKVTQPFLWIHGIEDDFLDFETHGKVVYKNYQGEYSQSIEVKGGDHGDVPIILGLDKYLIEVNKFIIK